MLDGWREYRRLGITQTEERAPVAPDGATGWHSRRVMVS